MRRILTVLTLISCSAVAALRAFAADYYVDGVGGNGLAEGGNDANAGTLEAPWLTLKHAVKQLQPGDTLYIRGGTYAEALYNNIPGGTSESARVTVSNHKDETVTLAPRREEGLTHAVLLRGANKSFVTVRGLVVEGGNVILHPVRITPLDADTENITHIRLENLYIRNGHNSGILTAGDQCEFIHIRSERNGGTSKLSHGIYLTGRNNVIDGCEFSYSGGYGLHIHSPGGVDNNIIRNCYSHHNPMGAIIGSGSGNVAYNNVFADNGQVGLVLVGKGTKAYNNTICGNPTGGIATRAKNARIVNNIVYKSAQGGQPRAPSDEKRKGQDASPAAPDTSPFMTNNFTAADPMFMAPEKGDFRLKEGSPVPAGVGAAMEAGEDGVVRLRAPQEWASLPELQVAPYDPAGYAEIKAAREALREERKEKAAAPLPPGVTYVVAPDGDDANAGTAEKPWKSLRKASTSAKAGDTVLIKAGEYNGSYTFPTVWRVDTAGVSGAPITFKAYGNGEVRITNHRVIPADGWKHVKGAIYSTTVDSGTTFKFLFDDQVPVHPNDSHLEIKSIDEMVPNSFYREVATGTAAEDKSAAEKKVENKPKAKGKGKAKAPAGPRTTDTLYVWLEDGSDPSKSVIRVATGHVIELSRCQHVVFDGLTVEFGVVGFKEQHATRQIAIRNCILRSLGSQGIQPAGSRCTIENNLFQYIGTDKFKHAIYAASDGLVVRNNVFENIAGAAIHFFTSDPVVPRGGAEIYGNIFRKPRPLTTRSETKYYVDVLLWARSEHFIYNNVFYGEGKRSAISLKNVGRIFNNTFVGCPDAMGFHKTARDCEVVNNIFLDSGLYWPVEATNQTLDYNFYFSAGGTPKWQCAGTSYTTFAEYQRAAGETHSKYIDPGLMNLADARLKVGSPAIDAAVATKMVITPKAEPDGTAPERSGVEKAIAVDIEGTPRPQGGAPDIGAYEFKSR